MVICYWMVFFLCMKEHICSISRLSRPHNMLETTGLPQKRNDSTLTQRKQKKKAQFLHWRNLTVKRGKTWKQGPRGVPGHKPNLPVAAALSKECSATFSLCLGVLVSRTMSSNCGIQEGILYPPRTGCIPPEAGVLHCPVALPWCPSNHTGILSLLDMPFWNWL